MPMALLPFSCPFSDALLLLLLSFTVDELAFVAHGRFIMRNEDVGIAVRDVNKQRRNIVV